MPKVKNCKNACVFLSCAMVLAIFAITNITIVQLFNIFRKVYTYSNENIRKEYKEVLLRIFVVATQITIMKSCGQLYNYKTY